MISTSNGASISHSRKTKTPLNQTVQWRYTSSPAAKTTLCPLREEFQTPENSDEKDIPEPPQQEIT
jgi:hypothetical protein